MRNFIVCCKHPFNFLNQGLTLRIFYIIICLAISVPVILRVSGILFSSIVHAGGDATDHTPFVMNILESKNPLTRDTQFPTLEPLNESSTAYYPPFLHIFILILAFVLEVCGYSLFSAVITSMTATMFLFYLVRVIGYAILIRLVLYRFFAVPTHCGDKDIIRVVGFRILSVLAFGTFSVSGPVAWRRRRNFANILCQHLGFRMVTNDFGRSGELLKQGLCFLILFSLLSAVCYDFYLLSSETAEASRESNFTNWIEFNGTSTQIAVGNYSNGNLVLFSVGVDDHGVYFREFSEPHSNWTSLGGQSKHITIGNNRDGTLVLFSVGLLDDTPYVKHQYPNGTWNSNWTGLGGQSKQIAVGNDNNGTLVLFSIGMNSNIPYYKYQSPNGTWNSNWTSLGGQSKQIAVGNDMAGRLSIFSIGLDGKAYYQVMSGGRNFDGEWISLGGALRDIRVQQQADLTLTLFGINTPDDAPYVKTQLPDGSWSKNWLSLGGQSKQLTVVKEKSGEISLFSIGSTDDSPYYKVQLTPNGRWGSNWTSLGGQSKQIAVGSNNSNSLVAFSIGLDDQIYYKNSVS